jgi:hypothetical protein
VLLQAARQSPRGYPKCNRGTVSYRDSGSCARLSGGPRQDRAWKYLGKDPFRRRERYTG